MNNDEIIKSWENGIMPTENQLIKGLKITKDNATKRPAIPPIPWQLIEEYPAGHYIADANGVGISKQMDRNIKNYVIRVVNCHDELVEALELALKHYSGEYDDDNDIEKIKQTLSKAGE